jgi:hypothetical protein
VANEGRERATGWEPAFERTQAAFDEWNAGFEAWLTSFADAQEMHRPEADEPQA